MDSQSEYYRDGAMESDRVPLPHEDFDRYLSDFTQYDSMLDASLSNIQDLAISNMSVGGNKTDSEYSGSSLYQQAMSELSQVDDLGVQTLKPQNIAKFSKMLNLNNVAATQATLENRKLVIQRVKPPITPNSSPVKGSTVPSTEYRYEESSQENASDVYSLDIPPTPSYTPSHSPMKRTTTTESNATNKESLEAINNSNSVNGHLLVNLRDESESEFFSSPSHSPNLDNSPEISNFQQLYSGITPHLQGLSVFQPMELSSSTDRSLQDNSANSSGQESYDKPPPPRGPTFVMPPTGDSGDFNWKPIVTAPDSEESRQIIHSQLTQNMVRASHRKSCLPPGRVDEYLAGPSPEGLFECLYPNCGKLFRRRYNIRSHIQTHLCDRPYTCDRCGSSFVRPHDLRRHEKVHQDDRPHVCPCGKGFTRHDALYRHRQRMICVGGIQIPGKPKKVPAKRGRPRKNPLPNSSPTVTSDSETDVFF